jgi:hypothetical protein
MILSKIVNEVVVFVLHSQLKGAIPVKAKRKWIILAITLAVVLACAAFPRMYTIAALNWARSDGVFATPQDGAIFNANRGYCGVERVEIDQNSANSFDGSNPHIWYVIYTVYAKTRAPCDSLHPGAPLDHQTYERGGQFYLNVKDGWVMMPEGMFPEFIGFWMKVLNLAGSGDPTNVERK